MGRRPPAQVTGPRYPTSPNQVEQHHVVFVVLGGLRERPADYAASSALGRFAATEVERGMPHGLADAAFWLICKAVLVGPSTASLLAAFTVPGGRTGKSW